MRQNNVSMLYDTLSILREGSYRVGGQTVPLKLSLSQMEEVMVYLPEDVEALSCSAAFSPAPAGVRCAYSCENEDSFTLARKRREEYLQEFEEDGAKPILVLNLANPVNPGGGVRRGAKAQEEDLCRKSSLLLSLESEHARRYYEYNRARHTYMGSDAVMIHPQVEIIRDGDGSLLPDTVVAAVMTCAAPMVNYGFEGMTQEQYEGMIYKRIAGMLKAAAHHGYRYLVLGAFGCGAFGNDARVVSDLFYRVLKEFDYGGRNTSELFRRIDFAVMDHTADQYNYKQFCRNFADFYREQI